MQKTGTFSIQPWVDVIKFCAYKWAIKIHSLTYKINSVFKCRKKAIFSMHIFAQVSCENSKRW